MPCPKKAKTALSAGDSDDSGRRLIGTVRLIKQVNILRIVRVKSLTVKKREMTMKKEKTRKNLMELGTGYIDVNAWFGIDWMIER